MLRISKIVSRKLIETLHQFLYTPLATCLSNDAPANTRNTKTPVPIFDLAQKQRRSAMKVKALVVFMVRCGLVMLYGEGRPLLPIRTHSTRPALHNPTILEPTGTIKRKAGQAALQPYYLAHINHRAIIATRISSSPTDHWRAKRDCGRAPPLRI